MVSLEKKLGTYDTDPTGMKELWDRVETEWSNIDYEVCQNLISSMPRRIAAVLEANGGHTDY